MKPVRIPRRGRVIACTGLRTFLGRNLFALLEQDDRVARVIALDIDPLGERGAKARSYEIDLTQPTVDARISEILRAEAVDTVVHLAFRSTPTHATAWAHELESAGTMHLLNACRQHDLRRLIVASQTLVYGAHPDNPNFLTEDHALRGFEACAFVQDKIQVEREVAAFADARTGTSVAVLRMAPILGPTVSNFATQWLAPRVVPTALGFDPLLQFLHEMDAVAALKLAIDRDTPGVFNIASAGVLPVSTTVKLAGRVGLPLPYSWLRQLAAVTWATRLTALPPEFTRLLRYLCVVAIDRAQERLGYQSAFSAKEAVLDLGGALRLRDAKLLTEAVA